MQVTDTNVTIVGHGDGTKIDFGEIDGSDRGSKVEVSGQGASDFLPDGTLSLFGGSSDMRGQDGIGTLSQSGDEIAEIVVESRTVRTGFRGEDVDGGSGEMAGFESVYESGEMDDLASRVVDQVGTLFHLSNLGGSDHILGLLEFRHVEGDKVRGTQQLFERLGLSRRSEGHDGHHIVVEDLHPKGFRQDTQLTPDMTIPDDSQRLASDLPTPLGNLVPDPFPHLPRTIAELTGEGDDLADDEFGDGSRVGKGRVKDGDSGSSSGIEVDLVGPDTETTDGKELNRSTHTPNANVNTHQPPRSSPKPPPHNHPPPPQLT